MQALGVILRGNRGARFLRAARRWRRWPLSSVGCHPLLRKVSITVACDVNNPLCVVPGAHRPFWPTKGATAEMVALDAALLENWGRHIYRAAGREVINAPGAGAAD